MSKGMVELPGGGCATEAGAGRNHPGLLRGEAQEKPEKMKIPTHISKCDKCPFHYLYADYEEIRSGCKRPEGVIMDCFGALERREEENEH